MISKLDKFIIKSNLKHNFKYDYSKVIYVNNKQKIIIICPYHGEFLQIPNNHQFSAGCPACYGKMKYDTSIFIEKSNLKHNFKYDYSKVDYDGLYKLVTIICPEHGEFEQKHQNILKDAAVVNVQIGIDILIIIGLIKHR